MDLAGNPVFSLSVYELKPRFQGLLRPLVHRLFRLGVTANAVTIAAAAGSMLIGGLTAWLAGTRVVFALIPIWLFARMALNAMDGMLAREFGQESAAGAYLNEVGDVVSDAALYAPFALVDPFHPAAVALVIGTSMIAEFCGALGPGVGASRRYDGPMGKSDRAIVFGVLGAWIAVSATMPAWLGWAMPILTLLLLVTTANRIRAGVLEAGGGASSSC